MTHRGQWKLLVLDYRFLIRAPHFPFAEGNIFAREKKRIAKEAKEEKEKITKERNTGRRNVSSEQRERNEEEEKKKRNSRDRLATKG